MAAVGVLDVDVDEASRVEPTTERPGIDRHEHVVDVQLAERRRVGRVGADEARCECDRQGIVDLQRNQAVDLPAQRVGGETWTGPDLEHVVAEVSGAEHPRQHVVFEVLLPAGTCGQLQVQVVHVAVPLDRGGGQLKSGVGQTHVVAGSVGKRRTTLLITVAVTAALDWTTKTIAASALNDRSVGLGLLDLRLGRNSGVAFGMGDRLPSLVILAVTATVLLAFAFAAARGALEPPVAAGLVLGGGVANLVDRAIGGSVVDFLDVGWWPTFNLADVFLSAGCLLMVTASFRVAASTDP